MILAVLALAGCGSSDSTDTPSPSTTAPTVSAPDDSALRSAAAVYGREEDGAERVASPEAMDALASAVADYLTSGGTLDEAAEIAQEEIERTIGRDLPPGTMAGVLAAR